MVASSQRCRALEHPTAATLMHRCRERIATEVLKQTSCLLLAHRDGRHFDDQPSLSEHCGHGWTCSLPRPVAIEPFQISQVRGKLRGLSPLV